MTEDKAWKHPIKKVGIIGADPIGSAICRKLLRTGPQIGLDKIAAFDADAKALSALDATGIAICKSVAHLADTVDLVLLSLPKRGDVAKLARSHEGLLDCARQGQIIIDHSWSPPELMHQLATAFTRRGAAFLDAPIGKFSDVERAIDTGRLAFAIGGDRHAIDAALPSLHGFAAEIDAVGPIGAAQVVRQMSDLVAFQTFTALVEARAAAGCFGIDGAMLIKALAKGHGDGNGVALHNYQRFLEADQASDADRTTISDAERRLKDVVELAEGKKLKLAAASSTLTLFEKALEKGFGEEGLRGLSNVMQPEQARWRQKMQPH